MSFFQILVLAVVQGAAELLPVSSSAHVIVAAKLLGLDPTSPAMTLLLVMLHTGTMFAVIVYFWRAWQESFFSSSRRFWSAMKLIFIATIVTGVVGLGLKAVIEKVFMSNVPHAEIELLFGNLALVAIALAAAGVLIIWSGLKGKESKFGSRGLGLGEAVKIGAIQGFCLPFRGFSRSGATISAGLLMGLSRVKVEEFSFALAVVLTPPVVAREVLRLVKAQKALPAGVISMDLFVPGLVGMVFSFIAGLVALRWLSSWLEHGRWHYFGVYCLCMATAVFALYRAGF